MLASGSNEYLNFVLPKLKHHQGPFVYATDIVFKDRRSRDVARLYAKWTEEQGLTSSIMTHAEFGGVTSAFHLLSYRGVDAAVFSPRGALLRVPRHILDPAAPNAAEEAARPTLLESIPQATIVSEGAPSIRGAPRCILASTMGTLSLCLQTVRMGVLAPHGVQASACIRHPAGIG
jgi:hypothetical protein